jgi:hypothetical protein
VTPRVRALLVAAFCGLVLFARVYVEFPTARLKLVTNAQTAAQGALSVDVPYSPRLAEQPGPLVVIAHFENASPDDVTINLTWNSATIGSARLGPRDRGRFDFTLPPGVTLRGADSIRFRGPHADWRLTYLEFANLHGSARGLVNAVFVPSPVQGGTGLAWPVVLLIAVVVAWVALQQGPPWAWKPARILHATLVAVVVALFAVSLLSGIVSRYKVLLAWDTFWIGTVILLLRGVWRMVVDVRQVFARRWLGSPAAFDSIVVAFIVAGFFTTVMFIQLDDKYKGNYSGFLQLNKDWLEATPVLAGRDDIRKTLLLGEHGYDGMFMYLMTFDPFLSAFKDRPGLYARVVDTPPYRYTRIGFSLLTRLFAWNHPERYPATMMWLIIGSHFVACVALGAIIRTHGGHPAWALLYIFIPGYLQSLGAALPESIAGAGVLIGLWAMLRSRFALAAVCLAAAMLVRETVVIFVVLMVLWLWFVRREWRAGFIIGLASVPLVAWRAFVTWRLFPVYGWDSLLFLAGSANMPFKGMIDLQAAIRTGTYYPWHPPLALAGNIFPLVLTAALIAGLVLLWKRRDGLSAAIVAYALLAVSHDYPHVWSHVGNAERVTYDVFLLLLAALATLGRESRALRATLLAFFAFTIVYTVYFSFDAVIVRAVLFSPVATIF